MNLTEQVRIAAHRAVDAAINQLGKSDYELQPPSGPDPPPRAVAQPAPGPAERSAAERPAHPASIVPQPAQTTPDMRRPGSPEPPARSAGETEGVSAGDKGPTQPPSQHPAPSALQSSPPATSSGPPLPVRPPPVPDFVS